MGLKQWILIFTLPSGSRFVLGQRDDALAMFPVNEAQAQVYKDVFSFDTELEARRWMRETAKMSEQGAKLIKSVTPTLAETPQ